MKTKRGKMPVVGNARVAIVAERDRAFSRELCCGIADAASRENGWMLEFVDADSLKRTQALRGFDGVIARVVNDTMATRLVATGLPVVDVFCNKRYPNFGSVDGDQAAIGRKAAEHFLARRFTSFAYCGYEGQRYSDVRCNAFVDMLKEHHLLSINNSEDLKRRGIAWELYVSADGRSWRRIDCRKYVADDIPKTNNTLYSPEPYPISAANESDYAPLHVNMPAGTTHNNTTVFLSGGVQFVKEGAGTFLATKAHRSYVGGTEVVGGTLKMGTSGDVSILGIAGSDVTICSNTVVDINGIYNNTSYNYALKGGKLAYYGTLLNGNLTFNGDYEVLEEGSELAFANVNTSNARFTLHGHTLRTSIARLEGNTVVADEGTLDYHCRFYVTGGATFTASSATVIANAMHQFAGHATLGTYIERSVGAFNGGDANMAQILKVFRPDTDFFYGFKLNDGVTIDLTARSTPLPLISQCPANNTLTFADGATITLDVTGSPLRRCGKIVSWEVGSAPSNINTLKFRVEVGRPRSPYRVRVKDDGIYFVSNGTMVIVR